MGPGRKTGPLVFLLGAASRVDLVRYVPIKLKRIIRPQGWITQALAGDVSVSSFACHLRRFNAPSTTSSASESAALGTSYAAPIVCQTTGNYAVRDAADQWRSMRRAVSDRDR